MGYLKDIDKTYIEKWHAERAALQKAEVEKKLSDYRYQREIERLGKQDASYYQQQAQAKQQMLQNMYQQQYAQQGAGGGYVVPSGIGGAAIPNYGVLGGCNTTAVSPGQWNIVPTGYPTTGVTTTWPTVTITSSATSWPVQVSGGAVGQWHQWPTWVTEEPKTVPMDPPFSLDELEAAEAFITELETA